MRRTAAVALALALVAAGCGLAADDEPRAIAPENLPSVLLEATTTTTTTAPQSPSTVEVTVYFLRRSGDRNVVAPVTREVTDPRGPADVLRALLSQPPSQTERDAGLTTAIPSDTALLDARYTDDARLLTIDLSRELFDIQGAGLRTAFAQLVWTATEMAGIDRVQFLVDGEDANALTGEGEEKSGPVSRADYQNLRPE